MSEHLDRTKTRLKFRYAVTQVWETGYIDAERVITAIRDDGYDAETLDDICTGECLYTLLGVADGSGLGRLLTNIAGWTTGTGTSCEVRGVDVLDEREEDE